MKRVVPVCRALVASVLACCVAGHATAACLHYEPKPVTVNGIVVKKTYPGPPNFEDVAQGDAPETGYYLQLIKPLCTQASEDEEASSHAGVQWLQLVLSPAQYAQLQPRLGKAVRLRGTLFEGATGHHHTQVLLTVTRVE
jgi:hypothetical protein